MSDFANTLNYLPALRLPALYLPALRLPALRLPALHKSGKSNILSPS